MDLVRVALGREGSTPIAGWLALAGDGRAIPAEELQNVADSASTTLDKVAPDLRHGCAAAVGLGPVVALQRLQAHLIKQSVNRG